MTTTTSTPKSQTKPKPAPAVHTPSHARMIWSVFRRNFVSYFINPTGYVFITVFILLGAVAAFWHPAFFLGNLANLDPLNYYYPVLLLFFVPALTMNVWSEERRLGTDELLLTLPGRDADIVFGKYLAVLGIYTVAVIFSLSHLLILAWLGDPDMGLMASTYFGYWISGAALLAVGMIASQLTSNATVAFIFGALFCIVLVFIDQAQSMFAELDMPWLRELSVRNRFAPFGDGVVALSSVLYFLAVGAIALYINVALLKRRHVRGGEKSAPQALHLGIRAVALFAGAIALLALVDRTGTEVDATAERLHTLQPQTETLIDEIPDDRPVYVQAFFSEEVPEGLIQTKKNLLNTLQRMDALGGSRVELHVHNVEPFTDLANSARENYNILPQRVFTQEGSQRATADIFLGLVFTSGPEEFVIPFFEAGLPVEYELARSIRVVTHTERKKIGIVTTDANVFGGFDFQTMASRPDWSIVNELRKQYDVEQVDPAGPYPTDLDALVVVMGSTLTQPQLDTLKQQIVSGTPTLLIDDPLPMFNPQISPRLQRDAQRNPFTARNQPPMDPKGNFDGLLADLGLVWGKETIAWAQHNPHPAIAGAAPEIAFITEYELNKEPFHPESVITSGLQEVVFLYSGYIKSSPTAPAGLKYTPLVRTGTDSGTAAWTNLLSMNIFGVQINPSPRRSTTNETFTLAMQVAGTLDANSANTENQTPAKPINVIMIPDADVISEMFFDFRRQGVQDFNFDNVTFALNCIDVLAGDESFVTLRKHRPKHRTLTRVEEQSRTFDDERQKETEAAEKRAAEQLEEARSRLNEKVLAVQQRKDLDDQAKAIMIRNIQNVENRRLQVVESTIEREKEQALAAARSEMQQGISRIQGAIKLWAAIIPPIPAFLLAIGMFAYRRKREKISVSERTLVEESR